ncbi:hypothetical protein QUF63_17540 [Anaerolineales bacterium HSG25]|nr:hypothetical protein [Anaerolineales bacterium HSG25]
MTKFRTPLSSTIWLVMLLLGAMFLTACGGAEPVVEAPTSVPAEEVPPTDEPEPTEVPEEEVAETEEVVEDEDETSDNTIDESQTSTAKCEAIPIPDNPLIAQVSDTEWIKGPVDAPITLIEYSDFQ